MYEAFNIHNFILTVLYILLRALGPMRRFSNSGLFDSPAGAAHQGLQLLICRALHIPGCKRPRYIGARYNRQGLPHQEALPVIFLLAPYCRRILPATTNSF